MRTIRTKVYQFNELNDDAKQVAISKNSDINVNYDWWFMTYEDAENIGLKLNSFDLDRNKNAKGKFIDDAYFCATEIVNNHGVDCDTYKLSLKFISEWNEAIKLHSDGINIEKVRECNEGAFDNYVYDSEIKFLEDILECYANILQGECEYLQGDEAIKETLISNEYEFTKDGNMFNS